MSTDDYGTEYIYPPAKWGESLSIQSERICAQDERFASVNEALGLLDYKLEQHITQCADGLAPLADFISASWAVIDELEARIAKLEEAPVMTVSQWPQLQTATPFAAAAHPPEGDWAHIPSAEWESICEELEGLRAKWDSVPWSDLDIRISDDPYDYARKWFNANAPKGWNKWKEDAK